jgi:hypothetical protein
VRIARATDVMSRLDFVLRSESSSFFLSPIDSGLPSRSLKRTKKISEYIESCLADGVLGASLIFMASDGPAFRSGKDRLGIWSAEQIGFQTRRSTLKEDEFSLEMLASERFLKEKTRAAKKQYHIVMEDIVSSTRAVTRIFPGDVYPGSYPGRVVSCSAPLILPIEATFRDLPGDALCSFEPEAVLHGTILNSVITYIRHERRDGQA